MSANNLSQKRKTKEGKKAMTRTEKLTNEQTEINEQKKEPGRSQRRTEKKKEKNTL